jgi:predicted ATPase with chaperone activity
MVSQRLTPILPPLTFPEGLNIEKLSSIAARGPAPAAVRCAAKTRLPRLPGGQALLARRPFRSPHHFISDAGLISGGRVPRPGEVSPAQDGVLFLDELPESRRDILEVLRQSLESSSRSSNDWPAPPLGNRYPGGSNLGGYTTGEGLPRGRAYCRGLSAGASV